MLEFQRKETPRFKEKHVTSVLECAADLRGVQSELQIGFTINCFGFRIVCDAAEAKIINVMIALRRFMQKE